MVNSAAIKTAYSNPAFNGWVQFYTMGKGAPVFLGACRVGDVGAYLTRYAGSWGATDVYMTKNIMQRAKERNAGGVFAYNAIVIDLDMHGYTPGQIRAAVGEFEEYAGAAEPRPNMINHTGRGLQIWYFIEPVYKTLAVLYERVQAGLFGMWAEIAERAGVPLEIDTSTGMACGLVRVPGSWNYHTQAAGYAEVTEGERYTLQELAALFPAKRERKKSKAKREQTAGDCMPMCCKRAQYIKTIVQRDPSREGNREKILFVYHNYALQVMGEDAAADATAEINRAFTSPLSAAEVGRITKRQRTYKMTKGAFLDFLGASAEDKAIYEHIGGREAERQAARDKKAARDKEIYALFLQGYNKTQIAEVTGVTRPTVYAVIKREAAKAAELESRGADAEPIREPDTIMAPTSNGETPASDQDTAAGSRTDAEPIRNGSSTETQNGTTCKSITPTSGKIVSFYALKMARGADAVTGKAPPGKNRH